MEDIQELMEAAARLADGAGAILRRKWNGPRTVEHKSAVDLVTDADKASEAFLIEHVHRFFPTHAILAEESGASGNKDAPITWVMDPLDGTTNYAHGFPHFNVSIAACGPDGMPLAGCVLDPLRMEAFVAGKGQGAWLRETMAKPVPIHVSKVGRIQDSLLASGFPYDRAQQEDNNTLEHAQLNLHSHGVRRAGAAALDLAYVAAGRCDGYWEATLKPWDVAAGALLVLEAGGIITGYAGEPFNGSQAAVVAAGPALHPALLAEIARVRREHGLPPKPLRS